MFRKIILIITTICFFASLPAAIVFAAKEKPFIFGLLLVGPYNDRGWSQAHFDGGKYVEKNFHFVWKRLG